MGRPRGASLRSVPLPLPLDTGARPPVGLERGAGEAFVVVVPLVGGDVVDRTPRDLGHLVQLRSGRATRDLAEIDDGHGAVRVLVGAGLAREHADEAAGACLHPRFLGQLAHGGLLGRLVRVDPARYETPLAVVGAVHEQYAV